HMLSMGNEKDLHTPHWHGKTVDYQHRHADVVELLPGSMATADMTADNPGTWLYHCHVSDHMENGMMSTYTVYRPPPSCPVQRQPSRLVEHDRKPSRRGEEFQRQADRARQFDFSLPGECDGLAATGPELVFQPSDCRGTRRVCRDFAGPVRRKKQSRRRVL